MPRADNFRNIDPPGRRILSVKVKREVDTDDDLSHLGEYSNEPGPEDKTITRENCGSREYKYFIAAMSGDDTGNPESVKQDYERMEAYNRQEWCMTGTWAEARVILSGNTIQTIRSPGLWGTESDSKDSYFEEIAKDELALLREQLESCGFTKKEIDAAFKKKSSEAA